MKKLKQTKASLAVGVKENEKEVNWRFNNSDPKSQLKKINQWVKEKLG
jgi:transposase-like protein